MVSVTCHVALFATTLVWSMFNVPFSLGDPSGNPGGAVVVNPVNGIPLPQTRTERENPVANPVQHNVPSIPEPPQPRAEPEPAVPELDAVPIEAERKRRKAPAGNQQKYQEPLKENQLADLHRPEEGKQRRWRRLRPRQPVWRPVRLVLRSAAAPPRPRMAQVSRAISRR
jgi:hypothetical protein